MLDRNKIIEKHYRENYKILVNFFRGDEDKVQTGYLRSIENYDNWRDLEEEEALGYITVIIKNLGIPKNRNTQTKPPVKVDAGFQLMDTEDDTDGFFGHSVYKENDLYGYSTSAEDNMMEAEEQLEIRSLARMAEKFLNSHPKSDILRAIFIDERSYREVAHDFKLTENHIQQIVFRFREDARKYMIKTGMFH